jgi:hypothetical protein
MNVNKIMAENASGIFEVKKLQSCFIRPKEFELCGEKIQLPSLIVTSKQINGWEKCTTTRNLSLNFDVDIFCRIELLDDVKHNQYFFSEVFPIERFKKKIVKEMKCPAKLKLWHPQIRIKLTTEIREKLFNLAFECNLNLLEFPYLLDESVEEYLTKVIEKTKNCSDKQVIIPVIPVNLPTNLFRELMEKLTQNNYRCIMISGNALSKLNVQENYKYIESDVSNQEFIIASDIFNVRNSRSKPLIHRGLDLMRLYNVGSFIYKTKAIKKKIKYTLESAIMLDPTSINFSNLYLILNKSEFLKFHNNNPFLKCTCPICSGKNALEYYENYCDTEYYRTSQHVHELFSLNLIFSDLRNMNSSDKVKLENNNISSIGEDVFK